MGGTYGAVLLLPLLLISGVAKPGSRSLMVVVSDALGFAALALLCLQVFAAGRGSASTRAFGLRRILRVHRRAGVAVLGLVVVHVLLLIADDPSRVGLLNSVTAPPRAKAAMVATLGLMVLAISSVAKGRLGLRFSAWRALHLAATSIVLGAAFAHVVLVDKFSSAAPVRWTMLAIVVLAASGLFWSRVVRPYLTATRPYRVAEIKNEAGGAVTVELAPDGHDGTRFAAGQFARLRSSGAHYSLDDHPFSLSSAAQAARPSFTIKALGDFSRSVAELHVGTPMLLDGPHGEPVQFARRARGMLLVAAGIGITPAISVIRTAAVAGERRPLLLLYGSRDWEGVIFREELESLAARRTNLTVVHVLSRPEPWWPGERGRVGGELIRRYAPARLTRWRCLVCGPAGMVDETERTLRELGMARRAIQAEGF